MSPLQSQGLEPILLSIKIVQNLQNIALPPQDEFLVHLSLKCLVAEEFIGEVDMKLKIYNLLL
jgi:hypothetical protein